MDFYINKNGVASMPKDLKDYSLKLMQYKTAVECIKRIVISKNKGFNDLQSQFDDCIEAMDNRTIELRQLGSALEEIYKCYCNTEMKIVGEGMESDLYKQKSGPTTEQREEYKAYQERVEELYKILSFKEGSKLEALALWKELFLKMHVEDPSSCELTKEEKVAILMAIKPLADAIDGNYDEWNNYVNEHVDSFNSDKANSIEKEVIALLSTNGWLQNSLGFAYRNQADSYYTVEDSLQNQWGFCDYMDEVGNTLGMDLDTEISTFIYDGQEFRVQLWKGNYGWGSAVGGEFGIYSRPEWEAMGNPYVEGAASSEMILYDAVDEKYQLPVEQTTSYIGIKGDIRTVTNDTSQYGDGTHYWNLNIRTEAGVDKADIVSTYNIDCSGKDYEFQVALYNSLKSQSNLQVTQKDRMIMVTYR